MTSRGSQAKAASAWTYAGRFVLPVLLLAGALGAWVAAERLGRTDPADDTVVAIENAETPMTSIRRVPEVAVASSDRARVAAALDALPAEPGGLSCAVVLLDGEPILSIRSDRPLVGGYAQLFFAGHAALDILGPTYTYETQLMAEQLPDDEGRIGGGVYLIGSGDPVLMTQRYALGLWPVLSTRTEIEALADSAVATGLLRIDGGVIGVERRYDTVRSLPGWPESYAAQGIVGPLSALQIDDGLRQRAELNLGVAVPADFPATMAAERFAELLTERGLEVTGTRRTLGEEEALPSLVPVARISSPTLSAIVSQVLAVNDATAAELLLKELGVATSAQGTTQAGAQAVQRVLLDLGVDAPVPFRDGSGLDALGSTSCDQLAQAADAVPGDHPTLAALPAYNLPGVFEGRLRDVSIMSDVRMVGGTVGETSSVVGRTVDQGQRITFASIVNRPGGPSEADLVFQQALIEAIDDLRGTSRIDAIEIGE